MAVAQSVQEQRIILYNIGWDTYEGLLRDHANTSAPRFTYDRGTLEIMSPLPEHERFNRAIQLLVPIVVEEMGAEVYSLGSTTFNREDLLRGFEPDSCFYLTKRGARAREGQGRSACRSSARPGGRDRHHPSVARQTAHLRADRRPGGLAL